MQKRRRFLPPCVICSFCPPPAVAAARACAENGEKIFLQAKKKSKTSDYAYDRSKQKMTGEDSSFHSMSVQVSSEGNGDDLITA